MSLKAVKEFLISELNEINEKIRKVNVSLRDINLHIEEANYFIKELSNGKSSELSLTYISDKKQSEKLILEKSALEKHLLKKKEYDEELKLLLSKKKTIERHIDSINSVDNNKKLISRENSEKVKIINELSSNVALIKAQLEEDNLFLKKSIEDFSFIDPNRVMTDFKIYENRIKKINYLLDNILKL